MPLTLQEIARQNRYLISTLPNFQPGGNGSGTGKVGFLERKNKEEAKKLEAESEVLERQAWNKQLRDRIDGGGSQPPRTLLVNPEATEDKGLLTEVAPGDPIIVKIEKKGAAASEARTYVVNPAATKQEEAVQEVTGGKPAVIFIQSQPAQAPATAPTPPPQPGFIFNPLAKKPEEMIQEIAPGNKPTIIIVQQPAPPVAAAAAQASPVSWVDALVTGVRELGKMEEVKTVLREFFGISGGNGSSSAPLALQVKGADGQLVSLDIDTYIKLTDFSGEQRRKEESHKEQVELVKTIRENIPAVVGAAGRLLGNRNGQATFTCANPDCKEKVSLPANTKEFTCSKCQSLNEVVAA